jgi:sortase A
LALLAFLLTLLVYGSIAPVVNGVQERAEGALAPVVSQPALAGGKTVKALLPEDVLPKEELTGPPKFKKWDEPSSDIPPTQFDSSTSAGAIPAVKPFNFGKDPGGPEDKTLYLTVPELGLTGAPIYDSISKEKLDESAIHVPATGFPWQKGANTYIAGHRLGYPDTGSFHILYDLDKMAPGDEITLKDSAGGEYVYRVRKQVVVDPDNIEVMNAVPDKNLLTLQTCTLPAPYTHRIIVQGELVTQRKG